MPGLWLTCHTSDRGSFPEAKLCPESPAIPETAGDSTERRDHPSGGCGPPIHTKCVGKGNLAPTPEERPAIVHSEMVPHGLSAIEEPYCSISLIPVVS